MKVYGVSVSYYTGKLEAYLRYQGIPYEMDHPFANQSYIKEQAGAIQVPIVERSDGRWMSDSTPIILQLEKEGQQRSVLPEDEVVRFIALLIEDYGDEWLWRAAMHYRWSYEHDSALLSRILTDEIATHLKLPRFMKLRVVKKRQHTSFVRNDGVTEHTQPHVEAGYRAALQNMTLMLEKRPFLLGDAPTIADFGMMGPMLRHFGQDPTPAEIMRNEGPVVFAWLGRVWNAQAKAHIDSKFSTTIDSDTQPILEEICATHLVQLHSNAMAYDNQQSHFDMTVQGCRYSNLPASQYRVYCLEQLRAAYARLSPEAAQSIRNLLPYPAAEVLWQTKAPADSGYDSQGLAPFNKAINVFPGGTPK